MSRRSLCDLLWASIILLKQLTTNGGDFIILLKQLTTNGGDFTVIKHIDFVVEI
jgi:hypothetical protein